MPDPSVDPITWKEVVGGAIAACTGMLTYIVKKNDKRVEDIETTAAKSLEEHRKEDRETFKALFQGQADINEAISEGFKDVTATMHGIHTSTLTELNKKQDKKE